MKIFIIALNAGTKELRNEITDFLTRSDFGYWHWIDDTWIVTTPDRYTSRSLHDEMELNESIKNKVLLVLEVHEPLTYWGRNSDDAWEWLAQIGNAG